MPRSVILIDGSGSAGQGVMYAASVILHYHIVALGGVHAWERPIRQNYSQGRRDEEEENRYGGYQTEEGPCMHYQT